MPDFSPANPNLLDMAQLLAKRPRLADHDAVSCALFLKAIELTIPLRLTTEEERGILKHLRDVLAGTRLVSGRRSGRSIIYQTEWEAVKKEPRHNLILESPPNYKRRMIRIEVDSDFRPLFLE